MKIYKKYLSCHPPSNPSFLTVRDLRSAPWVPLYFVQVKEDDPERRLEVGASNLRVGKGPGRNPQQPPGMVKKPYK